jgi:hypothetical protein
MATAFKKGDVVQLNTVIPQGPVLALRMNDDGEVVRFDSIFRALTPADSLIFKRWIDRT